MKKLAIVMTGLVALLVFWKAGAANVESVKIGSAERKPAKIYSPKDVKVGEKLPVLFLLHGYKASGPYHDRYFKTSDKVNNKRFILVVPNGTKEDEAKGILRRKWRFWNATPECCDFEGSKIDDTHYLMELLVYVEKKYEVDSNRIAVFGFSNGGFMAHRMACDYSHRFSAVASLAGARHKNMELCKPKKAISYLQIHGSADETVPFGGNEYFPGAQETVEFWRQKNGCSVNAGIGDARDLDKSLDGEESEVRQWSSCRDDTKVELWTIPGVGHKPNLSPTFTDQVLLWLLNKVSKTP